MPLPTGMQTVTVIDNRPHPDGSPTRGRIVFRPEVPTITSAVYGTIIMGEAVGTWVNGQLRDANGSVGVTLLACDADDCDPSGWTYRVYEEPFDTDDHRDYSLLLTANLGPTVELADLAPTNPANGDYVTIPGPQGPTGPTGPTGPQPPLGAAGAGPTIALKSDDPTTTNARTPTAHAASHAAAGSDPVTLTQAQITGLVAALNALAPLAGAAFTGAVSVAGADLTITGTGKGYRFRRGGGGLDLEATGADLIVSNWSGTNYDGTQRSYLRLSADAQNTQVAGRTEFVDALYGATRHVLDGAANTVGLHGATPVTQQTVTGSRSDGTALANLLAALASTGLIVNSSTAGQHGPLPSDQNLITWTGDPNDAGHVTAQSAGGVAGRITLVKVPIREQITWSNIWIGLSGIDAGASLANCYLGVYDASGTLMGTTADISASLMTNAIAKPLALATPFTAPPGMYYIAMLLNGTWTTNSLHFKATGAGISVNAGLSAGALRFSNMLTAQTSLPGSLTLANQLTSIINTGWGSQWYGVS